MQLTQTKYSLDNITYKNEQTYTENQQKQLHNFAHKNLQQSD